MDLGIRFDEWQNSHHARHEAACAFLYHAVQLMPDSAEANRLYGACVKIDDLELGLAYLRKAIDLDASEPEGYFKLGCALADKYPADALLALRRAEELDISGVWSAKARGVIALHSLEDGRPGEDGNSSNPGN